jgi:regulator of nucleoside diphosphate kinase
MKTDPTLHVSADDADRLRLLIATLRNDPKAKTAVNRLSDELARAVITPERPFNTVGLDCGVEILDLGTGETERFTLTLPEQADIAQGRISILAPLGTALLGFAAGDEVIWKMPGGLRRLRIQQVYHNTAATAVH